MTTWTDIWRLIDARIERSAMRAGAVAYRCIVEAADVGKRVPIVQIQALKDQVLPDVEYFQHFGFRSNAPVGIEGIVLRILGPGGHRVMVATGDRVSGKAPTDLEAGETAIYSSAGAKVVCKADGTILVSNETFASVELKPTGEVVINGGVLGVARQTDEVAGTAGLIAGLNAIQEAIKTLTSGSVDVHCVEDGTTIGYISGGSSTVKAG